MTQPLGRGNRAKVSLILTLIVGVCILHAGEHKVPSVWAQTETDTAFPEEPLIPPPVPEGPKTTLPAPQLPEKSAPEKPAGFFQKLKRLKLGKPKEPPAPSDEKIIQVGPQQPPVSPHPLVRIPFAVQGSDEITGLVLLRPGFYLGQLALEEGTLRLSLLQGGRLQLSILLKPNGAVPSENATGPVQPINPKLPRPDKIEMVATPGLQGLYFQVERQGQRYRSEVLPAQKDARPQLGF